jgi:hypothetical protein
MGYILVMVDFLHIVLVVVEMRPVKVDQGCDEHKFIPFEISYPVFALS